MEEPLTKAEMGVLESGERCFPAVVINRSEKVPVMERRVAI